MKFYLISAAIFAVAWLVAYFLFFRHWLMQYKVTAGVITRIEAAEGSVLFKIGIWLEGKKTAIVAFIMSGFGMAKGAADHVASTVTAASNIDPTALQPLQDKGLWSAFFGDVTSFHIVAAVSLLMAFLTLKGKVVAAKIVPAGKA